MHTNYSNETWELFPFSKYEHFIKSCRCRVATHSQILIGWFSCKYNAYFLREWLNITVIVTMLEGIWFTCSVIHIVFISSYYIKTNVVGLHSTDLCNTHFNVCFLMRWPTRMWTMVCFVLLLSMPLSSISIIAFLPSTDSLNIFLQSCKSNTEK